MTSLQIVFGIAGVLFGSGGLWAFLKLRGERDALTGQAAQSLVSAATSLVNPLHEENLLLHRRVETLEKRIADMESGEITRLRRENETLLRQNELLQKRIATCEEQLDRLRGDK